MQLVNADILKQIKRYEPKSHKGDNGVVLVIAGSDKYHGALLLTLRALSRIVDMVYVHSVAHNLKIIDKLKRELATFISVSERELKSIIERADLILIGPGLDESKKNSDILEEILKNNKGKKIIIDATSLWQLKPEWLHQKCILTPHEREFEKVFGLSAIPQNVLKVANQYGCTILLTGSSDYISDGNIIYENQTGNAGMTKGGTGDVLAGIVAGLYASNDAFTSALAGAYLNGLAGDKLYEKKSTFYNAEDLIGEIGNVFGKLIK